MSDNTALVVPIALNVLCVNETKYDQNAVANFSGPTTDFSKIQGKNCQLPAISSSVRTELTQNTSSPLKGGIHVFWCLPETFRKQHTRFYFTTDVLATNNAYELKIQELLNKYNTNPPSSINSNVSKLLNNIDKSKILSPIYFKNQSELLNYIKINSAQSYIQGSQSFDQYITSSGDGYSLKCSVQEINTKYLTACPFLASALIKKIGVSFTTKADLISEILLLTGEQLISPETEQYIKSNIQTEHYFPAVPNRWLVSRIPVDAQGNSVSSISWSTTTIPAKSWIVESDTLININDKNTGNFQKTYVTIPVNDTELPFRYMGVSYDTTSTRPIIGEGTIESITGAPLQAVSTGEVHFSAYYPNCRNVFGFHDDSLPTECLSGTAPLNLLYSVIGWFSDQQNDPLTNYSFTSQTMTEANGSSSLSIDELQTLYNWTCNPSSTIPNSSLYFGMINNVKWNPAQSNNLQKPSIENVKIAIGNSVTESISTMIANNVQLDTTPVSKAEDMISLFQLGFGNIIDDAHQIELNKKLHERTFHSTFGGLKWLLKGKLQELDANTLKNLDNQLQALNSSQASLDSYCRSLSSMQQQLFYDWYRAWEADSNTTPKVDVILNIVINESLHVIPAFKSVTEGTVVNLSGFNNINFFGDLSSVAVSMKLKLLGQDFVDQIIKVLNNLGSLYQTLSTLKDISLKLGPAAKFYQPTNPHILFSNNDIVPKWQYNNTGLRYDDSSLFCRVSNNILTNMTVNGNQFLAKSYDTVTNALIPNNDAYKNFQDILQSILGEVCILQKADFASSSSVSTLLSNDAGKYPVKTGTIGSNQFSWAEELPSSLAFHSYSSDTWLPFALLWSIKNYPIINANKVDYNNATIDNTSFIINDYTLTSTNGSSNFISSSNININFNTITDGSNLQTYYGQTFLTPFPARSVISQLESSKANIATKLQSMPLVSCSLSGFNQELLTTNEVLQLNVQANNPDVDHSYMPHIVNYVAASVLKKTTKGPETVEFGFNPIRASYGSLDLTNTGFAVVDAFGQRRNISTDTGGGASIYVSSCMSDINTANNKYIYLHPRITQPSRLSFNWCRASDDTVDMSGLYPATPVCGWIVGDYINNALIFYNTDGMQLGYLFTYKYNATDQIGWQSAPNNGQPIDETLEKVFNALGASSYLLNFALSFNYNNSPSSTTPSNSRVSFFTMFLESMRYAYDNIDPPSTASEELRVLMSSPLAMAHFQVGLELQGNPAINQTWKGLSQDIATINNAVHIKVETLTTQRCTNGFEKVKFPIIFGDLNERKDGTVGYFLKPGNNNFDFSKFYSYANPETKDGHITPTQTTLTKSVSDANTDVLVIMDPRFPINIETGILPTASFSIEKEQYVDALKNLEVFFEIHPVLSQVDQVSMPTPNIAGYHFEWMQVKKENGSNRRWNNTPNIASPSLEPSFKDEDLKFVEGYLCLRTKQKIMNN